MWFTPVRERETVKLLRKVMNITDVVGACKDTGYEWFEQFLRTVSNFLNYSYLNFMICINYIIVTFAVNEPGIFRLTGRKCFVTCLSFS